MTGAEQGSPESDQEALEKKFQKLGIWNLEATKQREIWDKDNGISVVNLVSDSMAQYFRTYEGFEEEDDHARNDRFEVAVVEQLLYDPLAYVQSVVRSHSMGVLRYRDVLKIVNNGGLSRDEAKRIIDEALELQGGTRDKLIATIKLFGIGNEVIEALKEESLPPRQKKQRAALRQTLSAPLSDRKN